MHHAAMANKKEMMFTLARLGCDWRARAEGIDGATAAFVLCGQHGKTTRQQVGFLHACMQTPNFSKTTNCKAVQRPRLLWFSPYEHQL